MNNLYLHTPLLESTVLSRHLGIPVYLKMEAMQPSGSFKNRGIGHLCLHYVNEGKNLLISSSGGNAGLATAYSGRKLGVAVKVVVPKTTSALAKEKMVAEGAEVIVYGEDWDEADLLAKQISEESQAAYIPPFGHPLIWQGHSTLIYEVFGDGFKPGAILLSVGGGGLLCGILKGMHDLQWYDVALITAETEGAASFAQSVFADKLVRLDKIDTIATTLGAKQVAEQAFRWTKRHTIYPQILTDRDAVEACCSFADDHRVLVEPACGVTLAMVYKQMPLLKTFSSLLIIVCGGCGVNRAELVKWEALIKRPQSEA